MHAYRRHHGHRIELVGDDDGEHARQNEEEPPETGQECSYRIVRLEALLGILSFRNFQALRAAVYQSFGRIEACRRFRRLFFRIDGIRTRRRRGVRHRERRDCRYAAKRHRWRCYLHVFRW